MIAVHTENIKYYKSCYLVEPQEIRDERQDMRHRTRDTGDMRLDDAGSQLCKLWPTIFSCKICQSRYWFGSGPSCSDPSEYPVYLF